MGSSLSSLPPGPPSALVQQDEPNYVKEAFNLQYNWIALAGMGVLALISASALPLILAAGLELMYLAAVSRNHRFQRLVRSRRFAREQEARERAISRMLAALPPDLQARYVKLAQVCGNIRGNLAQLSSTSQLFVPQVDGRLQGLLNGYARLLNAAAQQRQHLKMSDPDVIRRELRALEQHLQQEPPKVQDINRKRIEILNKRLDKYQKIVENQQVVDAQCGAVEDVLQLVRDQSVTMRDPQQVSDQLTSLVRDVEQTEQTVQQVEAIFNSLAPDMEGALQETLPSESSTATPQRTRTPN